MSFVEREGVMARKRFPVTVTMTPTEACALHIAGSNFTPPFPEPWKQGAQTRAATKLWDAIRLAFRDAGDMTAFAKPTTVTMTSYEAGALLVAGDRYTHAKGKDKASLTRATGKFRKAFATARAMEVRAVTNHTLMSGMGGRIGRPRY